MASFKTLAALALLSVTTSTPTFSTTFRQELASPTWQQFLVPPHRRTSSIVLMPIEANVRRQQQEALASVSQTLFGECIRGASAR